MWEVRKLSTLQPPSVSKIVRASRLAPFVTRHHGATVTSRLAAYVTTGALLGGA